MLSPAAICANIGGMQISPEGKIGIALTLLGLAGGGAIVIAPNQVWIGWVMIAVAVIGLVLLVLHHFGIGLGIGRLLATYKFQSPITKRGHELPAQREKSKTYVGDIKIAVGLPPSTEPT
jgi:hypothetical protein